MRQKNSKKFWQIKYVLPIVFVVLILNVCVLITSLSYQLYKNHFVNNLSNEHVLNLSQVSGNIDKIKSEIITISDMFYHDEQLNKLLLADSNSINQNKTQYTDYLQTLDSNIHATLMHYSFEYDMQLIGNNQLYYSTDFNKTDTLPEYKNELWYYKAQSSSTPLYWLSSLQLHASCAYEQNYFSLLRFIKSPVTNETIGLLMINIPEDTLFDTYKELLSPNESNIYLVDTQGQIVSHQNKHMIGHYYYKMDKFNDLFNQQNTATIMKSGSPYLFAKYKPTDSSWIAVEEIPLSSIKEPFFKIARQIIYIVFIICILAILIAILISYYISHQITVICHSMESANSGDFNVSFPKKGFQEVQVISTACEEFIVQITSLLNDIKKREHLKQITELRFYQMQINPHFMHNTLFTIKCMVDMGKKEEACNMLDALNSMMKNILNTDQKLVTVHEEIETLKKYTYILQQRYANTFEMNFNIQQQCEDMLILRFILQPIIENSVFHGFSNAQSNGLITVSVSSDISNIILNVTDNGIGISPDQLKALMEQNELGSKHIGLGNIRSRLQLYYGTNASFDIKSDLNQGCSITIVIPQYKIS